MCELSDDLNERCLSRCVMGEGEGGWAGVRSEQYCDGAEDSES